MKKATLVFVLVLLATAVQQLSSQPSPKRADVLFDDGMTLLLGNNLEKSEKNFSVARSLYLRSNDHRKANECLVALGIVAYRQRRMDQAVDYLETALQYHRKYCAADLNGQKLIEQNLMLCRLAWESEASKN